jgi:hypothetical protein
MADKRDMVKSGLRGARNGAIVSAAGSIVSGVGMASVPIKILGLITIGTSTTVAFPVVASVAAGGAVVGGAIGAFSAYRRQKRIEDTFKELTKPEKKQGRARSAKRG